MQVIYDGNTRGVVTDAFGPLDQFWVKDLETNDVVRQSDGDIQTFSASQLERAPEVPAAKAIKTGNAVAVGATVPKVGARVLLIGTEYQMLQIIEHFGPPDVHTRREPQMLLAVPCSSCRGGPDLERSLCEIASAGIDDSMFSLAQSLRPDLGSRITIRASLLKQAMEQLGPELAQLDDYYVLATVSLPYGWSTIEQNYGERRTHMQDERCHIDLGVTAEGESIDGESSLDRTAMRVLGEACGIRMNEPVWEDEVQYRMRKLLSVDVPLKYWDGPNAKGFVLILPSDLRATKQGGLLTFQEPSQLAGDNHQVGGRSVAEWKSQQAEFAHLPRLPEGWIRIKSRSSDEIYFWNTLTKTSQYDHPLPEGWTKQRSKTTGKVYYFNVKKGQSVFVPPTEP